MSAVPTFDDWIEARALAEAEPEPAPKIEPDELEAFRMGASRILFELADDMEAAEGDARGRRDYPLANAFGARSSAYRHAAAMVARFRR